MFVSSQSISFMAAKPQLIRAGELSVDRATGMYWVSIPCVSASYGTNYNINANEIVRVDGLGIQYAAVSNPEKFYDGSPRETISEYLLRLKYAASDKSLLSHRSVYSSIKDIFPFVRSAYVAGAGSQYMVRDLVSAQSANEVRTDFLGKTNGSMTVPHRAFRDVFPPEADADSLYSYGAIAPVTAYSVPASIISANYNSSDPGLRGFRTSREMSDADYGGLYFNDGSTGTLFSTSNTFSSSSMEDVSTDMPNSKYGIGSARLQNYEFEKCYDSNGLIENNNIVFVQNGQITINTGTSGTYAYFRTDLFRQSGFVIRGNISPAKTGNGSDVRVMVGGTESSSVFTGLGFGLSRYYDNTATAGSEKKWILYLAHNSGLSEEQKYIRPSDSSGVQGGFSTLAETSLQYDDIGGTVDFMLTIDTDFTVSVAIYDKDSGVEIAALSIGGGIAKQIKEMITNPSAGNLSFGTQLMISGRCAASVGDVEEKILLSNVVVRDVSPRKPMALFLFDTTGFTEPVELTINARGIGSNNGAQISGHETMVWDNTMPSISAGVYAGGWRVVPELSGSATNAFYTGQKATLTNLADYRCDQVSSNMLAVLVTTSGKSYTGKTYGDIDIEAELGIDYIKLAPSYGEKTRLGNCVDLYVNSYNNVSTRQGITVTATGGSDGVIVLDPVEPIMSITSALIQGQQTGFTIVQAPSQSSPYRIKVIPETKIINGSYTIRYIPYYGINSIQEYFDSERYGSITGSVQVMHKNPVDVEINFVYSGSPDNRMVEQKIREYVDDNGAQAIDLQMYYQNLATLGLCGAIWPESKIQYIDPDTGLTVESMSGSVRPIDFFRISTVSAARK
jgi:hypothetical protein